MWLGDGVAIAHLALICGPAYLGDRVFVGFRATVFNARIGAGCTVGAHALVCDVEVPAGRGVPPGAIVTSQAQADRLPPVSAAETALAQYIATALLGSGSSPASSFEPEFLEVSRSGSPDALPTSPNTAPVTAITMATTMATTQISVEDVVRQFLAQGYRIGVEYADERRYRIGSWHSCATVAALSEREALAAVGACAAEHTGCYVRLFGVDAASKRRVGEAIVQRPQVPFALGQAVTGSRASAVAGGTTNTGATGRITPVALTHIRQWLAAGYKLGTEHADDRRFRTSSWHSCAPIAATSEAGAIAALEACLTEHHGEYVRLFGIDPKGKRRVAEVMLQRPGDGPGTPTPMATATAAPANPSSGGMATAVGDTVRQLLAAGHKVAAEHADERRFRIGSWHGCAPIEAVTEANVLTALAACVAEHPGEYVRLVGVDPKAKRRVAEVILQRPNGSSSGTPNPSASTAAPTATPTAAASTVAAAGSPAAQPGDGDVARQVREWLMAGHKIAMEYADARRFRIGSWQSCPPVTATTEAGVMSALHEYRQRVWGAVPPGGGHQRHRAKQRVGDRRAIVNRPVLLL
ncbi:MAG: carbon dioxide concentrating mechanism protein CcmM, partial [Oscillatoriales cyanobacterium SM2_1_8]|nr:carbon dioxide concentrating mechanism protein CcmM [Oscillatoriales cyanobacterium SM2_1_8]